MSRAPGTGCSSAHRRPAWNRSKQCPSCAPTPPRLGAHLARWGVPDGRIVELDWWQSTRVGGIEVTATPARHKSSRFFGQENKTLWAGFAVAGPRHRVWYSGDTGFHGALARIG